MKTNKERLLILTIILTFMLGVIVGIYATKKEYNKTKTEKHETIR